MHTHMQLYLATPHTVYIATRNFCQLPKKKRALAVYTITNYYHMKISNREF